MTVDWVSVPIGFAAGVLGVLSPCVWPLIPVVLSSAMVERRLLGPALLVAGLSLSFTVFGGLLVGLLLNAGLDPAWARSASAGLLAVAAAALLVERLGDWLSQLLSRLTSRLSSQRSARHGAWAQFSVGALLGIVWLPCVGPTLGAAIGLASLGEELPLALSILAAYGLGTGAALGAAAALSRAVLARFRPSLIHSAERGRRLLGGALLLLALLVLTGADRRVEAAAVRIAPGWSLGI